MIKTIQKYSILSLFCLWLLAIGYLFGIFKRELPQQGVLIDIDQEIQNKAKDFKNEEGKGDLDSISFGELFGSINGTKYYSKSCINSKRVKSENRIWFSSENEALEAGYAPAKGC